MSACRECGREQRCTCCEPEPLTQRERFIRDHASRLEAAHLMALIISGREPVLADPRQSWQLAIQAWDAKPGDA